MSIVHVKGDSQPAPPPASTSSERIYPLGRGASTLDAQQQADWVRRRSSIRKQLSSGAMGGEAPPPIPTAAQTAKLAQLSPALKVVPNSPPVSHRKSSIGQEESLSPSTRTGSFGKRVLASAGNAMSRMLKRGGSRRGSSTSGPGSAAAQAAAAMMKRESGLRASGKSSQRVTTCRSKCCTSARRYERLRRSTSRIADGARRVRSPGGGEEPSLASREPGHLLQSGGALPLRSGAVRADGP